MPSERGTFPGTARAGPTKVPRFAWDEGGSANPASASEQDELRQRLEGEAVVARGPVELETRVVLLGAVAHVGLPAIARVARGQPLHEAIAHGLRDDRGRRDRLAAGVAIDQGIVRVTHLGQGQA